MEIIQAYWELLKEFQRKIAAGAIIAMGFIALWCYINNVDPVVDTAHIEAVRIYEVHKARSESAHANIKAIDAALSSLDNEKSLYWATMRAKKITNTTARVRMETFIALTGIWWERRDAVLAKYWSPESGYPDFRECWEHILACNKDMQAEEEGLHSQYLYEESLLGRYRVYGIESIVSSYKKVVEDDFYDKRDICDRTLEAEKRAAYPEAWEAEQATRALEMEREEEVKAQRDDLEAFDVAYAGASEVGKTKLVLTETAKASAGWTAILLVVVVCGFGWLHTETEKYRGSFPTRDLGATKNGVTYEVTVPSAMFHRPTLSSACHKNWKAGVDFWGWTVLRDRMGNRVVVDGLHPSFVGALLASESLLAFAATGYENGEALKDAKSAVATRNRLLVLVVEALRKSTDFQRSKVIGAIRENLIKRMNKEIGGDTSLWKALSERQEEEGLSEQATQ